MKPKPFSIAIGVLVLAALLLASASGTLAQDPNPPAGDEQGPGMVAEPSSPAGTGTWLTYQGRLTSSSGSPVNSSVQMVFKIYDDSDTLLWTSATRTVTPVNGLFTVYLGASPDPALSSTVLAHAASIGVTVGSDAEMTPRQPLNTVVGYAASGYGVFGSSNSGMGVYGVSQSNQGVHGEGGPYGVFGFSHSGIGVHGGSLNGIGISATSIYTGVQSTGDPGMLGVSTSGTGVWGKSDSGCGVYGSTNNNDKSGVYGFGGMSSAGTGVTGWGGMLGGTGVIGQGGGLLSMSGTGVYGTSDGGYGVYGQSASSRGVYGQSTSDVGVFGRSTSNTGVAGFSTSGVGVWGRSYSTTVSANTAAVRGESYGGSWAGYFDGDVAQSRTSDGLVKAGVFVNCTGTGSPLILLPYRSFNNVIAGGLIIGEGGASAGLCSLNFNFQIDDRYFVATATQGKVVSCTPGATNTRLDCQVNLSTSGAAVNGDIMVLIY